MNARPLTDAAGVVRAWMCGACYGVDKPWSHAGAYDADDVARMRAEAEACCRCHVCGVPQPEHGVGACAACDAPRRAAMVVAASVPCPACHGSCRCPTYHAGWWARAEVAAAGPRVRRGASGRSATLAAERAVDLCVGELVDHDHRVREVVPPGAPTRAEAVAAMKARCAAVCDAEAGRLSACFDRDAEASAKIVEGLARTMRALDVSNG